MTSTSAEAGDALESVPRKQGPLAKRDRELSKLTKEELVKRVLALEDSQHNMKVSAHNRAAAASAVGTNAIASGSRIKAQMREASGPAKPSSFHKHPTRKIALLFAYEGWHYAGLAIQPLYAAMQTVEGELLAALEKTHLIEKGSGWDGCELSRCGRTDRGVSSAGQVVTLWIKSKRRKSDGGQALGVDWREPKETTMQENFGGEDVEDMSWEEKVALEIQQGNSKKAGKVSGQGGPGTEFAYPAILNRVLPSAIRVLAWSPLHDNIDFDARFSTETRHYRYFFSSDPLPGQKPLDLGKMQEAADRLLGENDFRNFCKLDGAKQIDNYYRTVLQAEIKRETSGSAGASKEDCVFELVGSAFLWHQVRHIMGILLLVGHGLEQPDVVTSLLNTGSEPIDPISGKRWDLAPSAYTCDTPQLKSKPQYQMAAALPLQLYRCSYDPQDVDWRFGSFDGPTAGNPDHADIVVGVDGLLKDMKTRMLDAKIRARHIESFYDEAIRISAGEKGLEIIKTGDTSKVIYSTGAGESLSSKKYTPLLQRPMGDSADEVNFKWRQGAKYQKRYAAASPDRDSDEGE